MRVATKKLLVMVGLLLICISFVGCGSSNDITGTWIYVESKSSDDGMHFYDDGTCVNVYKNHTSADATNWKIQEDGMLILKMEWDGLKIGCYMKKLEGRGYRLPGAIE